MSVFTVLNPATEEPVTTVTQASVEEADRDRPGRGGVACVAGGRAG